MVSKRDLKQLRQRLGELIRSMEFAKYGFPGIAIYVPDKNVRLLENNQVSTVEEVEWQREHYDGPWIWLPAIPGIDYEPNEESEE